MSIISKFTHIFIRLIISYFVCALLAGFNILASTPNWLQLRVKVYDKQTNRPIKYAQFAIFNPTDSTEITTNWICFNDEYSIRLPMKNARYTLVVMGPTPANAGENSSMAREIENQGRFESQRIHIDIHNLNDDKPFYEIAPVYLSRKMEKRLDEVVVNSSKVIFYSKRDTLIYNADSFIFSEGSTLDAIIKQLPGVELKKNGQIFVNGKFVESLLLNGKDLFNGNNELMIENLPAYTVKDIAVYEHEGRTSRLMGQNAGDSKYSMDVRLKRKYNTGLILDIEGGYGSMDRYIGRLFGMLFSDNVSVMLHGNANNLNDSKKTNLNDEQLNQLNTKDGIHRNMLGGLSYTAQGYGDKWEAKGNIDAATENIDLAVNSVQENYLSTANNYLYGWSNNNTKKITVSTKHHFALYFNEKTDFSVIATFDYSKYTTQKNDIYATLNHENDSINKDIVSNIFNDYPILTESLINRDISQNRIEDHQLNAGLRASLDVKTKSTGLKNLLTINTDIQFNNNRKELFKKYSIDYFNAPSQQGNQYTNNHPSYNWYYAFDIGFKQFLSHITYSDNIQIAFKLKDKNTTLNSKLFVLSDINGYDDSSIPIGSLPPLNIYLPTMNDDESFNTKSSESSYSLWSKFFKTFILSRKWSLEADYTLDLKLSNRKIDYHSTDFCQVNRTNIKPSFRLRNTFNHFLNENKSRISHTSIEINLSGRPQQTNLMDAVNRVNTANPTLTIIGNPEIRDSYQLDASLKINKSNYKYSYLHNAELSLSYVSDAISFGKYYNTSTGHQTIKPYNTDGKLNACIIYEFNKFLGKFKQFEITSSTSATYINSNDLITSYSGESPDFNIAPNKRNIKSFVYREQFKFNWKINKHIISLNSTVEYRKYCSSNDMLSNFSALNSNITIKAIFKLPHSWDVSTDFTYYIRHGYLDSQLNTSNFIWNSRISKSFCKGKLLIALDGYDLLHQISNVNYMINSQARTELIYNTVPNYILLNIKWMFNTSPKKKNDRPNSAPLTM